jgi:hypothetical protein
LRYVTFLRAINVETFLQSSTVIFGSPRRTILFRNIQPELRDLLGVEPVLERKPARRAFVVSRRRKNPPSAIRNLTGFA